MRPTLQPASDEHDPAIASFFGAIGVDPAVPWWRRCFDPAAPAGARSTPWLVTDEHGAVIAFAAGRPTTFLVAGDSIEGRIVHDIFARDGDDADKAIALLLGELSSNVPLAVTAGPSLRASRAIGLAHWDVAPPVARWLLPGDLSVNELHSPTSCSLEDWAAAAESFNDVLRARQWVGVERAAPARAWQTTSPHTPAPHAVLGPASLRAGGLGVVTASASGGTEILVTDLIVDPSAAAQGILAALAALRRDAAPVILSLGAPMLQPMLAETPLVPLPPRWSVHWSLGGPRFRDLGKALDGASWFLTALDLELDRG